MEFKVKDNKEKRLVAQLFHMKNAPDQVCLNIIHGDPSYVTTLYHSGAVKRQKAWCLGDGFIQNIYEGDEITIKF